MAGERALFLKGFIEKCTIQEANYNDIFLNLWSPSACLGVYPENSLLLL